MEQNINKAVSMLISINRSHKRQIDNSVSDYFKLHRTQHIILMHLAKGAFLSQKELAEHLNISPAAVTGILKKLEVGGYIKRNVGEDNRYNEIKITELGVKIVQDTKNMFSKIDSSLFSDFSESEIEEFISYLERIKRNIENKKEEPKSETMV